VLVTDRWQNWVIALLGHQQNQLCMQPPAVVGSIASIGFLEQINSPSGYHRDGDNPRDQALWGAAALRN